MCLRRGNQNLVYSAEAHKMIKNDKKIRGCAYSTGFSIEGDGVEVSTRNLKKFSGADPDARAQWHGAEHKLIRVLEEVLKGKSF